MKAILEFDLPDDQEAYNMMSKAFNLHHVLWNLDQDLRAKTKYAADTDPECKIDSYQEIRDKLYELLAENNIKL